MTSFIRFVTAALVTLAPSVVTAQATLTIDQAIHDTLAHNASLRAARAGSAADAAHLTEARAGWFPRISVSESWQRGDQPVFVFSSLLSARRFAAQNFAIDALNHPDAIGFFRTSVGVEQVLFDGGRQRAAVDSASLGHQIAELNADEAAAALALSATQTFGRILAAEAGGRAADAALAAAREDEARADRRRQAGMATDADVLALRAHVSDLEQRVIQARGDAAVARAELNRFMGTRVDRDYRVIEPSDADDAAGAHTNLDALLAEAAAARPELRRAAAAEQLADIGRKRAHTALIPQVAAQAAFDLSGTRVSDRTSAWLVGGEMRWNLSLGGAELAQMKAANETRVRVVAEAEDARATVHVEVVTALRRLETARAREAVGRAAVDQARESQRIIRDRFDAGITSVTDVLRASSAAVDADAQRTSAIVDAMVSDAMLRRALGRHP
jgi:outer membrane protein